MKHGHSSKLWPACAYEIHWINVYRVLIAHCSEEVNGIHVESSFDHSSHESRLNFQTVSSPESLRCLFFGRVILKQPFNFFSTELFLEVVGGISAVQWMERVASGSRTLPASPCMIGDSHQDIAPPNWDEPLLQHQAFSTEFLWKGRGTLEALQQQLEVQN